jgi:hypothetical protein
MAGQDGVGGTLSGLRLRRHSCAKLLRPGARARNMVDKFRNAVGLAGDELIQASSTLLRQW